MKWAMVQTSLEYPLPTDDEPFETFCLELFRTHLDAPLLQRYGRKGQKQHGVDLAGVMKGGLQVGVQCKARARNRMVSASDLDKEVTKAKLFRPKLDRFLLATTAPRDAALQSHAANLTRDHEQRGIFSVYVLAFEDLQDILRANHRLAVELCNLNTARASVALSEIHLHSTTINSIRSPAADIRLDQRSASEWIRAGHAEAAVDLLTRRKTEQWAILDDSERLALSKALANALLAAKRTSEASTEYFNASSLAADGDGSQTLAALSFYLSGDLKQARKHALRALKHNAADARAHMLKLRTEKVGKSFEVLLRQTPRPLRTEPEVAFALYERAAEVGHVAAAEEVVRAALAREHPWPPLMLALASILIEEQVSKLRASGVSKIEGATPRLEEAISTLSRLIEESRLHDPDGLTTEALVKRAVCYRILGRENSSTADIEAAYAQSSKSAKVAILYAEVLAVERNQLDRGIAVLDNVEATDPSQAAGVFLSELLRRRGAESDLEKALSILRRSSPFESLEPEEARVEAALLMTDLKFALEAPDTADAFRRWTTGLRLSKPSLALLEVDFLRRTREGARAIELASTALESEDESGPRSSRVRLARSLMNLGAPFEAFRAMRKLIGTESSARERGELLHCARSCGEDAFVLEFCAELRRHGTLEVECLGHEVETLLQYDEYLSAKGALQEYLALRPEDRIALVHLRWLALRHRWEDALLRRDDAILSAGDVPTVSIGAEVVDILRHSGRPEEALDYAYELWRKYPQEPQAHRALVSAVLLPGQQPLKLPEVEVVAPGMAVTYKELDTEATKLVVLETSENPRLELAEVSAQHEMARTLSGLRVGDKFELPGSGLTHRDAVVLSITDRRIHRAQESMLNWQSRFPSEAFLEPIPVASRPKDGEDKPDFSGIEHAARRLAERQDELESAYSTGHLPIGTLANVQQKSVFETIEYLAVNPSTKVLAAPGGSDDLAGALSALESGLPLVLDSTALATLSLLDQLDFLSDLKGSFFVLESTLAEIADLEHGLHSGEKEQSFLGYRGGRLVITQVDVGEFEERNRNLRRIRDFLGSHAQVIGGRDLALFSAGLRSRLSDVLPASSLQSIAAAAARGIAIWSDDRLAIDLAKHSGITVSHVWSHAVFSWGARNGALGTDTQALLAARLLKFGYTFTSINAGLILTALSAIRWDLSSDDAQALFRQFSDPSWTPLTAQLVLAETLEGIWRQAATVELARDATRALLLNFAQRADHRSILRRFAGQAGSSLDLWPARAQAYREYLLHYLQHGAFLV